MSIGKNFKQELKKAYGENPIAASDGSKYWSDYSKNVSSLKNLDEDDTEKDILSLLDMIIQDEKKIEGETKEASTAGGAGGYVGPIITNKEETKEAMTAGSSGSYDGAFFGKNPMKIDNPGLPKVKESKNKVPKFVSGKNKKNRYGGPGGVFVKVKEKCKTYPYCNQGDINALEFYEETTEISENKDIYKKNQTMNELKNYIENIVDQVLQEQSETIAESVKGDIDEMEEFYEIAKVRKKDRMNKKEMEETEMAEQNAFTGARCKAGCKGGDGTEIEGFDKKVTGWSDEDEKSCGCEKMNESKKTKLRLTEDELIDLIEKIVSEEKLEGVSQQNKSMKQSEKDNKSHYKEVAKKIKGYNKGYTEETETMPKTSGDIETMEKVAYEPNEQAEEYIEDFSYGSGLTGIDYDGAEPTEERQKDYLEGSSKTGNASKDKDGKSLGNAVPSEVGEKINNIRKKGAFAKNQKDKSYEKDAQPVETVKEEINRYNQIIGHNYSSQ